MTSAPTPALLDNMDGANTVLRLSNDGTDVEILRHEIDRTHYQYGTGAERVDLTCAAGHSAQLTYNLPPAPVIDELRVAAWVWTNRPGILLAAKVVLPRSQNKLTNQPYQLLVRGAVASRGNHWEPLTLEDVPMRVARLARVARAQHGTTIDERGAYVSQIVLLIPGGVGATELVVDRIGVDGVLGDRKTDSAVLAAAAEEPIAMGSAGRPQAARAAVQQNSPAPRVRSVVDDSSQVPRIIQWQGEPFELLARMGFDAVGMSRLPSTEELQQVRRLGLAIVCPPPTPQQITEHGISEAYAPVLAWDLGEQLSSSDLDLAARWQQLVKRYDPIARRPTLLAPQLYTREASRIADVVLLGRTMLGTSLTLQNYAMWLTQRSRLARPGTPLWTKIDTQLSLRQSLQIAALRSGPNLPGSDSYSQLSALTTATFGVKTRGFYFTSHSSLASNDSNTRRRTLALELTNLRLGLIEPWLAAGKVLAGARSTRPQLTALVLQAERSYLLIPIAWSSNLHLVNPPANRIPISFVVPGVPESSDAYLLTLAGLQRLRHRRVTGGVRISLDTLPSDGFVLLTNDPQAFSQVARHLRRHAPRAARLRRELAALRLQESARVVASFRNQPPASADLPALLDQARLELQNCDRYLASGNFELAYHAANAVDQALDHNERVLRRDVAAEQPAPENPLGLSLATLPDYLQLQAFLARTPVGANLLAGGGFENLSSLLQAGWRHHQVPLEGLTASVRLSPAAPHSGAYCLELEARPLDVNTPPAVVSAAPVWITSMPIRVRAGDIVEITGLARVPEPLLGTVDGLQIFDSLGGPDLALHISQAPSWHPFRLVRAAVTDGEVSVTIALTGLGKAQVDDIAIRTIPRPNTAATPQAAQRFQPLNTR